MKKGKGEKKGKKDALLDLTTKEGKGGEKGEMRHADGCSA